MYIDRIVRDVLSPCKIRGVWNPGKIIVVLPPRLYNSNICEILPHNRQWVVITQALIWGVRAANR